MLTESPLLLAILQVCVKQNLFAFSIFSTVKKFLVPMVLHMLPIVPNTHYVVLPVVVQVCMSCTSLSNGYNCTPIHSIRLKFMKFKMY